MQSEGRVKVDVKTSYRNVPVHPKDRWLMGVVWRDALLIQPYHLASAPVVVDKLEGLSTRLVFLGFELDTVSEVRLSQQNLEELQELIRQWRGRKELESLVGKLAHATQVDRQGRPL